MHPLQKLHQTLRVACMLLDNAASQIRDAKLTPTRQNITRVGEALAVIYEIKQSIYKQAPELQLEPQYEEPPPEVSAANRRLGEAMLAADDLAEQGKLEEAIALLQQFASHDPSEFHRELASLQAKRYGERGDAEPFVAPEVLQRASPASALG